MSVGILEGAYAVHARSQELARHLADEAGVEAEPVEVDLEPVPRADLFYVAFATGGGSEGDSLEVRWGRRAKVLQAAVISFDEDLGAEGVVLRSTRPISGEWCTAISRTLLAWAAERHQELETAAEVEAAAVHLSSVASELLEYARRCSQLASLDDRSWSLARILRRHASELHSLLPKQEEETRLLLSRQQAVEDDTGIYSEDDDLLVDWAGSAALDRLLPAHKEVRAMLSQGLLLLESARASLEETERLLAVLGEEERQRTDQGLNVVVYWLGLITVGLGLVTLWDKYQTDQVFGLPVERAAAIAMGLAIPLLLLFLLAAIRHGVLLAGPRRWLRRVSEPARRNVAWMRLGGRTLLNSLWPLRPTEAWFRWVDRERLILALSVLPSRDQFIDDDERVGDLEELEDEAEGILGVVWDSIFATVVSSELHRQETTRVGAVQAFDALWEEALRSVALNGLWFSLARPIPRQLWAGLLLLGRGADLSWSQPWCWRDVEGGDQPHTRVLVKSTVTGLVARKWAAAYGEPCRLSEQDLWGLVSGRELDIADLPRAPGGADWEALLCDVLPESEIMQELLEDLRGLRSGGTADERVESERE